MTTFQKCGLAVVFSVFLFCGSHGTAQDDTLGDLGIRVRQQNLDSYWLENRTWAEYGYRPHVTSHLTPFTSLPSPYAGKNYYSWGTNEPAATMNDILGRSSKSDIQMTKYGTWH